MIGFHWLSVENVAINGEELTNDQIYTLAQLFARLVNAKGVPVRLAELKTEKELGYHRMFHIGGPACPGSRSQLSAKLFSISRLSHIFVVDAGFGE